MVESKKRLSLLWRQEDWAQLQRVRDLLGVASDAEALRQSLGYTEALAKGRATIDGRPVVIPTEPVATRPDPVTLNT